MLTRKVLRQLARYLTMSFLLCTAVYTPGQVWAKKVDVGSPDAIMAKYIEAINTRRFDELNSVLSPNLLQHFSDAGMEMRGADALVSRVQGAVKNAPDMHLSLARVVASNGVFATMIDVTFSRNGKQVKQFWIDLWRIQNGKIAEHWES